MNGFIKTGLFDGGGSEWNEDEHPRDEDGKFTEKGSSNAVSKESKTNVPNNELPTFEENDAGSENELIALLGQEFTGYKGQEAVNKLLQEKHGHIRAAFHRDDIGDIDLLWGNDNLGLQHILLRRTEQGINANEFVKDISEVVEQGSFKQRNDRGNFEFWHKGKMAVIAPEYHDNKITYLLTAYKRKKK